MIRPNGWYSCESSLYIIHQYSIRNMCTHFSLCTTKKMNCICLGQVWRNVWVMQNRSLLKLFSLFFLLQSRCRFFIYYTEVRCLIFYRNPTFPPTWGWPLPQHQPEPRSLMKSWVSSDGWVKHWWGKKLIYWTLSKVGQSAVLCHYLLTICVRSVELTKLS